MKLIVYTIFSILWVFVYWPMIFLFGIVVTVLCFLWSFDKEDLPKWTPYDFGWDMSTTLERATNRYYFYRNPLDWWHKKKTLFKNTGDKTITIFHQ